MTSTVPIVMRFRAGHADMPKHARLRSAIVDAVTSGDLPFGSKMAGERELAVALGVSLGTTQKALARLMREGFLVRRQGLGTFVGAVRSPVQGSWHYRFLDADGRTELPVYATLLERELETGRGPWSEALGPDAQGYVRLRRSIDVGGKFACASEMYLAATRFGRLLRISEKRLNDVNLKVLLEADFAAPTLGSEGTARVAQLDARDCRLMRVAPHTWGLIVDIVGYSFARMPITFQRMSVPPTGHGLKLDFGPPGAAP